MQLLKLHTSCLTVMLGVALLTLDGVWAEDADTISLNDALHLALDHNPIINAARRELEVVQARWVQSKALPDPEVEMEYEGMSNVTGFGEFEERNFGVTQRIGVPLEWWYRLQAARFDVEVTRTAVFKMTQLDIAAQVKVAYNRVLLGQKLLDYSGQNLRLAQEFLEKSRRRLETGDVPQLEVLRADVEVGRAANQVTATRNTLSAAKIELNTLMGRDIDVTLEVIEELAYRPLEVDPDQVKQQALEQRPDWQGAEWAVAGATARRRAAKAAVVPDMKVGLFRQTRRQPTGEQGFWRVDFGLEVPLWAFYRQRGRTAEAAAEVRRLEAEREARRNRILQEVGTAVLDLRTTAEQVELFQEHMLLEVEEVYHVANRSYNEGNATYLELLEARRTLTEVRMEHAQALFAHREALYALEKAVGGTIEYNVTNDGGTR